MCCVSYKECVFVCHVRCVCFCVLIQVLVNIDKIPKYSQAAFEGFKSLNRIQSKLFKTAMETDENLLVCAPTVSKITHTHTQCVHT